MRPREGSGAWSAAPRFRKVWSTSTPGAVAPGGTACAVGFARDEILTRSAIEDAFVCVHGGKDTTDVPRVPIVNLLIGELLIGRDAPTL